MKQNDEALLHLNFICWAFVTDQGIDGSVNGFRTNILRCTILRREWVNQHELYK